MAETFEIGDIVRLKSGGPDMTVENTRGVSVDRVIVDCQWFAGKKLHRGAFDPETLVKVPNDE